MKNITQVKKLLSRITMECFGTIFHMRVEHDLSRKNGRIFLQCVYRAPCTKRGRVEEWKGRKYYLSEFMTEDEVVKTAYVAFESAVKHEVMEGFKVDGKILFNPHINFEELLKISDREIKRK